MKTKPSQIVDTQAVSLKSWKWFNAHYSKMFHVHSSNMFHTDYSKMFQANYSKIFHAHQYKMFNTHYSKMGIPHYSNMFHVHYPKVFHSYYSKVFHGHLINKLLHVHDTIWSKHSCLQKNWDEFIKHKLLTRNTNIKWGLNRFSFIKLSLIFCRLFPV